MNILTSVDNLFLLGCATILALIGVQHMRHKDPQKTTKPENSLEDQVIALRLSKMLDKLGVPRNEYFRYMSPKIIQGHINHCLRCTHSSKVHICDAYLDRAKPMKSMRFCPNYRSLIMNSRVFYCHKKALGK